MSRYIDADALIVDIEQEIAECEKWRENCEPEKLDIAEQILDTLIKCRIRVENMPTVDVRENVRGEWVSKIVKKFCAPDCWYLGTFAIEDSWNEEEGSWLEEQDGFCSECEKQEERYNMYKYCPHCSADMRGTE